MSQAKEVLASKSEYNDEDIKMWKYSIEDYLTKAEKDISKNDEIAFYFHAHYVLQNALEMSLALNDTYMPQPKCLAKLLEEKDPECVALWEKFKDLSLKEFNKIIENLIFFKE